MYVMYVFHCVHRPCEGRGGYVCMLEAGKKLSTNLSYPMLKKNQNAGHRTRASTGFTPYCEHPAGDRCSGSVPIHILRRNKIPSTSVATRSRIQGVVVVPSAWLFGVALLAFLTSFTSFTSGAGGVRPLAPEVWCGYVVNVVSLHAQCVSSS